MRQIATDSLKNDGRLTEKYIVFPSLYICIAQGGADPGFMSYSRQSVTYLDGIFGDPYAGQPTQAFA